jgi:hypothetical protein
MNSEYTVDCLVDEKYKPEICDWIDEFNKELDIVFIGRKKLSSKEK